MRNVLITGGAGFIGSNFIHYLLEADPVLTIVNLDALTYAGSLLNLKGIPDLGRHIFVHGNICDESLVNELFSLYHIDTVVHFAAESHVDRSILDPSPFIQTNVIGTYTLLEAARRYWLGESSPVAEAIRFHHISTDEVFGSLPPGEAAFSETTSYAPNSPYAASKAASDHLVRAYHHTYGLPTTISNCSNNYGPYQFPEKLIPLMILNALRGAPLPVYGDGQQIRDWLYVEDHCQAIWMILQNGKAGETYNIGGDNQPANLSVIRSICEIMDRHCPESPHAPHASLIQHVADRPGHDRRYAMDITKISSELGWRPRHSLVDGLEKTITWYLSHPDWIEAIHQQQNYQGWLEDNYSKRGKSK
jgi:dTDP-glucose 4,6-dehydratase